MKIDIDKQNIDDFVNDFPHVTDHQFNIISLSKSIYILYHLLLFIIDLLKYCVDLYKDNHSRDVLRFIVELLLKNSFISTKKTLLEYLNTEACEYKLVKSIYGGKFFFLNSIYYI